MSLKSPEERREAEELADRLRNAFYWASTPQGEGFWKQAHDALRELAEEPPACPACGQDLPK